MIYLKNCSFNIKWNMSTPNLIEISFYVRKIQVFGLYRLDKHISSIWTLFLVKLKQDSVLFRVLFRCFTLYLYHWSKRMSYMLHLDRYHIWNSYHPSWEYPYVISAYLHWSCKFESRMGTWRGVLDIILCHYHWSSYIFEHRDDSDV